MPHGGAGARESQRCATAKTVPARFRHTGTSMRRRRKKTLEAGREARRLARKAAAKPGATKVIEDKRKRPAKHKKSWIEKELQ